MDTSQRKAVFLLPSQSAVVIAPPGHGKTYVMAKRIAHLLQEDLVPAPGRILGLTFTNAAAREMTDRVRGHLGAVDRVDITTFHSFAYRVLRAYGNRLGIGRKCTVLSTRKNDELVTRALQAAYTAWGSLDSNEQRGLLEAFATWRQERILKLNDGYTDTSFDGPFATALDQLRQWMVQGSALDYDHVLWYARCLLLENPSILSILQRTYRYILVDEFQDTNPLQFEILRLVCADLTTGRNAQTPVLILADPQQAIYEFQGAVPANVQHATEAFECGAPIFLEENYRAQTPLIKALSTALRDPEEADYDAETGRIPLYLAPNPGTEAEWIVDRVQTLVASGVPYDEIAITARAGWKLNRVRALLEARSLPAVYVPDFRAGDIERHYAALFDKLGEIVDTRREARGRASLKSAFEKLCAEAEIDLQNDDIARTMYDVAGTYDSTENSRVPLWEKVQAFLNEILLEINWGEVIRRAVKGKVFVSSIHGVKGLQFKAVIICGLENYCFPAHHVCWPCTQAGRQSVDRQLDEEYRVLYVGITRAISEIHLYASLIGGQDMDKRRQVTCLIGRIARFVDLGDADEHTLDYCLCRRR